MPGATLTALLAVTLIPWHGLRPRAAGSGEINFRKHTIDLGPSETCAVADVNQDGKLDIISGENWYEQRSRSEEHTSELQSRSDLVCRLLLEKKKKKNARVLSRTRHRHSG